MTTDLSPAETVDAFLHDFEAMDFDAALSHLSEDCEYTNIPMGTVQGHEGVRSVLGPFFEPIHENEFVRIRKAAQGSTVFVERLDRHRTDHGWRELPVVGVFEVNEGQITVWRDYFDLVTAAQINDPSAA